MCAEQSTIIIGASAAGGALLLICICICVRARCARRRAGKGKGKGKQKSGKKSSKKGGKKGGKKARDSSDLPDGWEELSDDDTGATYFYNSSTEEVVWERPVASSKKSSKKSDKKQDKKKKSGKKSGKKPAAPARSSFASSCEMSYSGLTCEMTQTRLSTLGDAPLPSGWTEHYDASSGRYFYVNDATNETTWDRPPLGSGYV